ncbi:MAG: putative pre6S rRNA nuclease [Fimbriimonadaceae bacterium]|jgi:putative Holliday junction resolvase|nr:putative pre6S rRNA nuclease [Fimbriimonadaceae bacterium]
MRLLGVDFGSKRIGIAVAEAEHGIVTPRSPITPTGTLRKDAANLAQLAKAEQADAIVLGLPLEPGGIEGRMAKIARVLASEIEQAGFRVELVDETLTSVQAESEMAAEGLKASRRRKLRDGEAARLILERYLHGKAD